MSEISQQSVVKTVAKLAEAGLLAVMLSMAGCFLVLGAAGGTAGTVYVLGKLKDEITAPVPKVHQAAKAGLKDLGLPIREDQGDKLTAKLKSEFSDGTDIWIEIESKSDTVSQISIRVGLTGDEAKSRKILEALKKHL
jgi:Mn-dependent DtxR family transcriptional regulator